MDYRTCPIEICKHEFKYPSGLKRHFQLSVICKKNQAEIKQYFEGLKAPRPIKGNTISAIIYNKQLYLYNEIQQIKVKSSNQISD